MTGEARFKLACLGATAVLIGVAYYLALTHTASLLDELSLGLLSRSSLGAIGGSLPTFLHGIGFSFLTIAAAAPASRAGIIACCLAWCGIHWSFELLQPGGPWPLDGFDAPAAGTGAPLLGWLRGLSAGQRFDWADMAAALMAAVAALVVAQGMQGCRRPEPRT